MTDLECVDLLAGMPNEIIGKVFNLLTLNEVRDVGDRSAVLAQCLTVSSCEFKRRLQNVTKVFETRRDVSNFLASTFEPFVNFHFRYQMGFKNKSEESFANVYGGYVKKLSVVSLNTFMGPGELNFYNKLLNLEELSINSFRKTFKMSNVPFSTFSSVQVFSFKNAKYPIQLQDILERMPNIKRLVVGKIGNEKYINRYISYLMPFLRGENRTLVFHEFNIEEKDIWGLKEFLDGVINFNVRIENIDGSFVGWILNNLDLINWIEEDVQKFLDVIVELNSAQPLVNQFNLVSLSSLTIKIGPNNISQLNFAYENMALLWSNLKVFKMLIDLNFHLVYSGSTAYNNISRFLKYILENEHSSMLSVELSTGHFNTKETLAPQIICRAFPNMTCLTLDCSSFNNLDYANLFRKIGEKTQITMLKITSKHSLDFATFSGDDELNPVFLQMSALKHFELRYRAPEMSQDIVVPKSVLSWNNNRQILKIIGQSGLTCFSLISPRWEYFPVTPPGLAEIIKGPCAEHLRHFDIQFENGFKVNVDYEMDAVLQICSINKSRRILPPSNNKADCQNCFSY